MVHLELNDNNDDVLITGDLAERLNADVVAIAGANQYKWPTPMPTSLKTLRWLTGMRSKVNFGKQKRTSV